MNVLRVLTSNFVINVAVAAWFSAQLLKLLFTLLMTRRVDWERLVGSGGMPSSHSALTCSVAIALARKLGYASPEFGLAICLAAIVIYDAMGVRRAAGEQAKVLNRMIFEFPFFKQKRENAREPGIGDGAAREAGEGTEREDGSIPLISKELKELLGHTPFEVLGGCMLGILVAMFMPIR